MMTSFPGLGVPRGSFGLEQTVVLETKVDSRGSGAFRGLTRR